MELVELPELLRSGRVIAKPLLVVLGFATLVGLLVTSTIGPSPVAHRVSGSPSPVTHQVSGILLVEDVSAQASPAMDASAAAVAADAELENVYPAFTGFSVTSSHHAGKLYQANDQSDRQVFAVSDPLDAWVLEVQAAPQAGWKHPIVGVVIVDATTGRVKAASLFASN